MNSRSFLVGLLVGLPLSFLLFSPTMKFLCSLNGVRATTWADGGYYYSCVTRLDAWLWEYHGDYKTFEPKLYKYSPYDH